MKTTFGAIALALVASSTAISLPVSAATELFATAPAASQACGSDEVVWVDLDHGRFYQKNQSKYAKGDNGGYTCFAKAHAEYREAHE